MNRLLLFLLLLSSVPLSAQQTEDIFIEVPAKSNEVLIQRAKHNDPIIAQQLGALLGKKVDARKSGENILMDVVHIQSGKSIVVCLDTTTLSGNFGVLNDLSCSLLNSGTVSYSANCFTYIATTGVVLGLDTLCIALCDKDNNCTDFIYPIEVRNPTQIPFFEDFSTSSIVPNPAIWQNKDVFINNTIGIEPPSIGMATFDGLDKKGRPYGGGHGPSDRLTSTFIDLNAFGASDDVYMSFWVQPKGYGDRPEFIDSLVLEFKNSNGQWKTVKHYDGVPLDTPSTKIFKFVKESIQLVDNEYFHDGFQFRFTNYSTNSGAIDLWHIDYITIYPNQNSNGDLRDIAFTRLPEPLINQYTSIPWKHFLAGSDELLRDTFRIELYNHFNQASEASSSFFFISEKVTNAITPNSGNSLLLASQENIAANTQERFDNPISQFAAYKSSMQNDFVNEDSLIFEVQFGFDQNNEEREATDNNIVKSKTVFANYYAYDDGSAETNIIAQNSGTEIGIEFQTYVADSLRAIALSFINVKSIDLSAELFNLKVYFDSLQTDPVIENILLKPVFVNTFFDTIQSFTTYALVDQSTDQPMALHIPANKKFYIAFQTVSDNEIPIGFDKNSQEAASKNFVALSTGWFPFPQTQQGAVMMRPIFGNVTPQSSGNTVAVNPIEPASEIMEIFPNPTNGLLKFISSDLDINMFNYIVYNTLGQRVSSGRLSNQVDFSGLMDGIYYLKLFKPFNQKAYHHKFILAR